MNGHLIRIEKDLEVRVRRHLFQGHLEQAAFLFADYTTSNGHFVFTVKDLYLVPSRGWSVQRSYRLEMYDDERAEVMRRARRAGGALIDCHSHPGGTAAFSLSDVAGITEFAPYVHWKLDKAPYVAMVWSDRQMDGIVWIPGHSRPDQLTAMEVLGSPELQHRCTGSWVLIEEEST